MGNFLNIFLHTNKLDQLWSVEGCYKILHMKRLILPFVCWVLYALFAASQCKKDKPKSDNPYGLPNATQTGQGIFASLINGQPWISKKGSYYTGASVYPDSIGVSGCCGSGVYFQSLGFVIKGSITESTKIYLDLNNGYFILDSDHDCDGNNTGYIRYFGKGSVTITKFNKEEKLLSGKFDCIIAFPDCDTLKITEGRFDHRYHN